MKKHTIFSIVCAAAALLSACAPNLDDDITLETGGVDFSSYIAVGNSLTAGFSDGGLYLEGQKVAYPNLLAQQFQRLGGAHEFRSPFFSEDQANGSGYLRLVDLVDGSPVTEQVTEQLALRGLNPAGSPLYTKYLDPIENLGVPGMRLDLSTIPGIGSAVGNPYFERLLSDEQSLTTTYMEYASSHPHSFFSFWLGNNDVLGYATNGGVYQEDDPTTRLISLGEFEQAYQAFIDALSTENQKGVVATIPDVTAVPFFNTVTTQRLNAAIKEASGGLAEGVVIQTKAGPRMATDQDLFVLTFPTELLAQPDENGLPYGIHPGNPIADQYVLDEQEAKEISELVKQINSKIKSIAASKDLAVADIYSFLNKVKTGYIYNGIEISSAFITGNAFSLDGIHLTPIGNAIVANVFIDAINAKYKADVPKIDITSFRGVKYPND